jgi:hypothetical protein
MKSLTLGALFGLLSLGLTVSGLGRSVYGSVTCRNAEGGADDCQPVFRPELLIKPAPAKQPNQQTEPEFEAHGRIASQAFPVLLHSLLANPIG